ncbi:MAG: hypothetical protein QGG36_10155 [Pirellulaceae bacterium]|nr:hypothetical protein [Pirellulaceae bacterium]MDP7016153.1 hypothetical protein [Pirellulaceae bacterium]
MPDSILEAIKQGLWDYEPEVERPTSYASTGALPGSHEKVTILASRVQDGLPLWHPEDRRSFDEREE